MLCTYCSFVAVAVVGELCRRYILSHSHTHDAYTRKGVAQQMHSFLIVYNQSDRHVSRVEPFRICVSASINARNIIQTETSASITNIHTHTHTRKHVYGTSIEPKKLNADSWQVIVFDLVLVFICSCILFSTFALQMLLSLSLVLAFDFVVHFSNHKILTLMIISSFYWQIGKCEQKNQSYCKISEIEIFFLIF